MDFTRTSSIKANTGESSITCVRSVLIAVSALYNQTWNVTYATNKGQYRGSDHYTIQSSYISSNATYPGLCAQAVTQTSLDLTATTFSYPPQVNIQTKTEGNLATIHYQRNDGNYYYVIAFIQYPVIANQIYEVTFDYYQEVTTGHDASYFVEVGDNDYNGFEAYIRWYQEQVGTPTERSQYDRYASMSGDNSEMEPCWKDKVMPQTFPRSGVWNTAKLYMKPETDSAHLRWDFSNVDTSGLQWKNVYVTQLPADYCRKGN